jgi:hypothetical protein
MYIFPLSREIQYGGVIYFPSRNSIPESTGGHSFFPRDNLSSVFDDSALATKMETAKTMHINA